MGGTTSKSTSDVLTELCINATQESVASCVQAATQEQRIAAQNIKGDVTISGTTMSQSMAVNMSCVLSADTQNTIQQNIANQIVQYAKSEGVALLSALGKSSSEAVANVKSIFTANVKQSNLSQNVQQNIQKQSIDVATIEGTVVIKDIDMVQTADVIAKAIVSSAGYSSAISTVANALDQKTETKEVGPLDSFFSLIGSVASTWIYMIIGIVLIGGIIMIFFMTFMLPKFLEIFQGFSVQLPASTRMLIAFSNFISGWWWMLALVGVGVVILVNRYISSEGGKRSVDRWKMSAPIVGKAVRTYLFGQFARTLGTLLHNGVPVLMALEITEQATPNVILKEAIRKTREEVTDGKTIAQPLARSKVFPQMMVDLIKIGEETGDVPGALNNVAEAYESELTTVLRVMLNMIEPLIISGMALGVGLLLVSLLEPLFKITSNINVQ